MLLLHSDPLCPIAPNAPCTPLNAVWAGEIRRTMPLPELGHLFLVFPLGEGSVISSGAVVDGDHYLWMKPNPDESPLGIENLASAHGPTRLLLLLLSPDFIAEMADFLGIPADMEQLIYGLPLLRGDAISQMLASLAGGDILSRSPAETEEYFLEVVGQVLRLLRQRSEALESLAGHKENTLDDLLPHLMQARQFIEARFLEPNKTADVAAQVAMSEFHFARLFKTAFDVTVHQYVLRLRMDQARYLLEGDELRITEISLEVGYSSLSAFIHAFRKRFGMTPSGYRGR